MDFRIKQLDDVKELSLLRNSLLEQPLWYKWKDYEYWVGNTCIPDIESGWKTAYLAFYDNYIVGNAIFQQHKEFPDIIEFKNLRVHPNYRDRYLGLFLAKQVIVENKGKVIIGDADVEYQGVIRLMQRLGFRVIGIQSLYQSNRQDVILFKGENSLLEKMGLIGFPLDKSHPKVY